MAISASTSVLVVACGNRTRGDDAFGPLVIEELNRLGIDGGNAVDLGQRPDRLIDLLGNLLILIVVDAVEVPALEAGKIVELNWAAMQELPDRPGGTHGFSLIAQLQFANRLGLLPPTVRFIGVTIGQTGVESPPQPLVLARVRDAVSRIVRLLSSDFAKARIMS